MLTGTTPWSSCSVSGKRRGDGRRRGSSGHGSWRRREKREEEKKERAAMRREEVAQLKAAGLWHHPLYKTLKAARADGWHKPRNTNREEECGGEEMTLKGHTLVRNTKIRRYHYKTTLRDVYGFTPSMIAELGPPDKTSDYPHPCSLYLVERIVAWIEKNLDRVDYRARKLLSDSVRP
jgi:hypothetical protein